MGIGVSGWQLAGVVARLGQLGVVSGAGAHIVMSRVLQHGDEGSHYRRALAQFPDQGMAERVLASYFVAGGIDPATPFRGIRQFSVESCREVIEFTMCANFAQVWLAKEGHGNGVGVNFLEKVQLPFLFALYGALLAGVDYILIGAGVPNQVPAALQKLARHESASYLLHIPGDGANAGKVFVTFDPADFFPPGRPQLKVPKFFPIVASASLAQALMKSGDIDGFVIEGPTAGGHNAPPRGHSQLSSDGEPVYGPRDEVDFERLYKLERPFWLAGGYASPAGLQKAISLGAQGIQVGSIFALCEESRISKDLKQAIRRAGFRGEQRVFTDPRGSPTGFPFKVATLPGTLSEPDFYAARERVCDLRGLQELYRTADGSVGYRCPAEPVEQFVAKGGNPEATVGRKCLCNALLANLGLGQWRADGGVELPLVTLGDDLSFLRNLMTDESSAYTAEQALAYLLS
ncbi:MAG: hypothetical protein A3B30_01685 [Candidatus Komeilibacteria bacterium RIFCSPLOWO2_01_FULL_52_15]|uniref:Uncharacterized protein n=1 Tax=Candidatus Komeilibacteria bacterium RIFCSPLOWO2_01_FULL_52_15 TaxID=1798551 RepID=A0A1G2BMZ8_9BACT|nr:MAG: hypothetical protein A3B30_01685 [Candidatus Komeilibacteria bacterium RIFCSPLOWO2_01_FULL_52_15]